jgi:hypothetical protein
VHLPWQPLALKVFPAKSPPGEYGSGLGNLHAKVKKRTQCQVDDDVVSREVLVKVALGVREERGGRPEARDVKALSTLNDLLGRCARAIAREEPDLNRLRSPFHCVDPATSLVERRPVRLRRGRGDRATCVPVFVGVAIE